MLAHVEFKNLVLCQITSKAYSSKNAIGIGKSDFKEGSLPVKSFVRPDKIFSADSSIIKGKTGDLKTDKRKTVLKKVRQLFAE